LFGDSYAEALLKFLAESFRRFVFAHSPTVDLELVERERPNLVVSLMAERFLIQVPDDARAPSFVERERAKREAGAVRRKVAFWAGRLPSLWAIERTRADLIGDGRFEDATIVSTLAYAGLRPAEVQSLRWGDVGGHEIHVGVDASEERASGLGPERRVRLMAPVADDIARWRQAQGDPTADELVFPGPSGIWKKGEWQGWHEQVFRPVAERYGLMDT